MSSEASFFEMLDLSSPSAKYAVNGLIPLCIPYLSNMVTNPFCAIYGLRGLHSYGSGLGILFASTYIGRGFGFRTSAFAFIMAFYLSPLVTYKYYFPSDKFGFKISTINLKLEFCQVPDNKPYLSPLEPNITKVDHRRFRCFDRDAAQETQDHFKDSYMFAIRVPGKIFKNTTWVFRKFFKITT